MQKSNEGLIGFLLDLPIFEAEWVLWLLIILWFVSVAVMIERYAFFHKRQVDATRIRSELDKLLRAGNFKKAASLLEKSDSLETNVVLFGLRQFAKGPEAVEDLLTGAESSEKQRFQKRLSFLATVGSNAPFIGLFGTVLGIIKAFGELGADLSAAGGDLMNGISEALVATGVGLVVAIPAVIAFNYFNAKLEQRVANTDLLARTLLAQLKSEEENAGAEAA
ncbi:MAG: MotA/TolQ/ExbB proton channel family protein [Deltaproteobacteria bacterium]|nr:MotA/TolQ/ExbB proton channel family protein [Deltaproteobacteria bacterium]